MTQTRYPKARRSHDRTSHIFCHNAPAAKARDLFKSVKKLGVY